MNHYYITGTSRGIGKALAETLLEKEENKVYGVSRHQTIEHTNYKHFTLDLSDLGKVKEFKFLPIENGDFIALVNNAGAIGEIMPAGKLTEDSIIDSYSINLISPSLLINKFISFYQHYKTKKVIINISSGAGKHPIDAWSTYCASKAGLDMFTRVVAGEQKINQGDFRVFSIAPGIVDTQMQKEIRSANPKDFSRLNDFLDYKNNYLLNTPELVAKKIIHILHHDEQFNEIVLSINDF